MSGSSAPNYDDLFQQAGASWNVDPALLKAVSKVESGGDPNATSKAGARGLMQIMPATGKALGVTDLADPKQSVFAAAALLRQNLDRYGNVPDALRAYNGGTDPSKWSNAETSAYPGKVAGSYQVAQADTGTATDATPGPAAAPADPGAALLAKYGLAPPAANSNTPAPTTAAPPASDPAPAATPTSSPATDPGTALLAKYGLAPTPAPATLPAAAPAPSTAPAPVDDSAPSSANFPNTYRPADVTPAPAAAPVSTNALAAPLDTTGQPDTIYPAARNALAPAPNTTYGSVLPLAKDDKTGQVRLALPSSLRGLAEGGLDLLEGPATGQVTPAATNALASGLVPGAMGGGMIAEDAGLAARAATAPRANALAAPDAAAAVAAPAAGPALPASMGAAASRDGTNPLAANFTDPREAKASQATGEAWRMSQGAPVGKDATIYVPGYKPTAADIAGDPGVSGQYKAVSQVPGNEAAFVQRNQENNAALIDHFDEQAGTPTTLNTLKAARSQQAQTDLDAAFANKGTANAQPVIDTIQGILAGPDGKRPAVQKAMKGVMDGLYDADGNLETDPEQLYGVRKAIDDRLSRAGQAADPESARVAAQLQAAKGALDGAIQPAAPGFDTYLKNFADASKPIDTQQLLQGLKPNLLDASGTMTLSRVNSMMKQIVSARAAPGIDPANSIDDATMDNLFNLRSQLLQQNNRNLGKPGGSDTSQLLAYGSKLGLTAAHGIAAHTMPVVGNALVHFGSNALSARSLAKRTNALLNPDLSGP